VNSEIRFSFAHGIGDCVYAAMLFSAIRAPVRVWAPPIKQPIFRALGITTEEAWPPPEEVDGEKLPAHPWETPCHPTWMEPAEWAGNKQAWNADRPPLPPFRFSDVIWRRLSEHQRLTERHLKDEECRAQAEKLVKDVGRPVVLLHAEGRSPAEIQALDANTVKSLCTALGEHGYKVIILDTSGPRLGQRPENAVLTSDCYPLARERPVQSLWALYDVVDLFIGIDSGPLHLSRLHWVPTVGVWTRQNPPELCPPWPHGSTVAHVVPLETLQRDPYRALAWRMIPYDSSPSLVPVVVKVVNKMRGQIVVKMP
jgi:hypothetical protein